MQMRLRLPFFVVFLLSITCLFFILHDTYRTFEVCSLLCSRARTGNTSQDASFMGLTGRGALWLWQADCQHNCGPQTACTCAMLAMTDSSRCTCECWQWYSW